LESDDKSVNQIALDLGFSESGYFIKTFKQNVGITPFAYKKLNIKSDMLGDSLNSSQV
jgi:AraC-like DNA-binding protein